jgi:2-C-methyl-D-erythritol 2,4-cyclodiphosphate synthase
VKISEISAGIKLSQEKKNVIFGYFSQNSIKKVIDGKVIEFLNRDEIFETQTPQISDLQTLLRGMKSEKLKVKKDGIFIRDEAELLELIGEEVFIYECSPRNHKITTEEDFSDTFRIGVGEDLHRFANVKGKRLNIKIGGVEFPDFDKVFEANSDGDPVLHALCNALLSAIGEKPFSSFADEMCRTGITNSTKYVERTLEIVRAKYPDFQIQNVAISLELLEPKIAPKHNEILENMAQILNIAPSQIGLMYTTGEGLKYGVGAKVEVLLRIL